MNTAPGEQRTPDEFALSIFGAHDVSESVGTNVRSAAQQAALAVYPSLRKWVDGFLVAKRAQQLSRRTVSFYREKIANFIAYAERRNISTIEAIDPGLLRDYLLYLEESGHNPGGIKAHYTTVRTFLRWYEVEAEPDGWRNPIRKVKPPKVPDEIQEPISMADFERIVETCASDRLGIRDRAILLTLLDTGARATELLAFDVEDLDHVMGALTIRHGKGGKGRVVFVGQRTRKAIRAYLKVRGSRPGPLFLNRAEERLKYNGLRTMVRRRAEAAGLEMSKIHAFRRSFTIESLRAGADLLTLQRLLGHADLTVLKRYAKQAVDDLRAVHAATSPVDRAGR